MMIPREVDDFDGINYLTKFSLNEINKRAKWVQLKLM